MTDNVGAQSRMNVPKNKGTKQLFQNPILEKLSRTHISIPLTIFFSYAAALLYWSITHTSLSVWTTVGMFAFGFVLFTWVEYMTHRYVFHMDTYTKWREKLQYTIHGVHHEYPKDKERLAMPPLLSITIATVLLLGFRLVLGDLVFAFLPGFLVGYAFYLSVHYIVHVYQPPKNIFKALWINHSVHHYKHGEYVFGVSSPFWDYVYGTMRDKQGKDLTHAHHHNKKAA
ncbi:MAG TPA: sterol desaturase family protein [Chryseosolibacter sp.]